MRLREDVSWRLVEDEVVILDVATSRYFGLNGSAAVLWPALVDGADADALADQLQARYGINRDVARADVDAFLTAVRERGLLCD